MPQNTETEYQFLSTRCRKQYISHISFICIVEIEKAIISPWSRKVTRVTYHSNESRNQFQFVCSSQPVRLLSLEPSPHDYDRG